MAGVAILVGWSPIALTPAVLLSIGATLVATCTYGLAGVYTRRRLNAVPAPTLAPGQQLGAAAWLLLPALWQLPAAQVTRPSALSLVALVVLCTAVAYRLYFRLLASIGPTRTTTVTYLIPVSGTLWGALFLGESLTPGMLVGLGIVLASVLLVNEVRLGAFPARWRRARGIA